MNLRWSSILLLILGLLSPGTLSMRYELNNYTKCIGEDIHANSMSVGKYFIVNPNEDYPLPASHKISVKVMPPNGEKLVHESHEVESGEFSFTAVETGNYIACILHEGPKLETTLTVDFDWRTGVHSKDWTNVAKKSQVESMELEVKKLFDIVSSIQEEMFYLREREEEMQQLNRSTNSKMAWLSFMSLGVCLSVAGLQFWHLKTFFQKKKII